MDKLRVEIKKIVLRPDGIIEEWETEFQAGLEKIKDIVNKNIKHPQNRSSGEKKVKRLSTIEDADSDKNRTRTSETSSSENASKHLPSNETSGNTTANTSSRPQRAAKIKIENNLKEKPLNSKLRRPVDAESSNKKQVKVKVEKISNANNDCKGSEEENKGRKAEELVKRKSDDTNGNGGTGDTGEPPKKVDESLIIVKNDSVVIEIQDDDTAKLSKDGNGIKDVTINETSRSIAKDDEKAIMPPPTILPKKKNIRKGQKEVVVVEKEKSSLDLNSADAKATTNLAEAEKDIPSIKREKDDCLEVSLKSVRSTRGKSRKQFKHKPMKEEKCDEDQIVDIAKNSEKQSVKRSTLESVYEDAVFQDVNRDIEKSTTSMQETIDKLKKFAVPVVENTADPSPNKLNDASFVSAKDIPLSVPASDATFVAGTCPQSTFIMHKTDGVDNQVSSELVNVPEVPASMQCNNTFAVNGVRETLECDQIERVVACNDATFKVHPSGDGRSHKHISQNSLLTDDESEEEAIPVSVKSKSNKQIFNPFVQSPVKKKVEAFEKHASSVTSSSVERPQTRAGYRAKENKEPKLVTTDSKTNTPILSRNLHKFLTPTQFNISPLNTNANKKLPNSTSKLIGHTKVVTKTSTSNKTQSLSRDSSTEDPKRGLTRLQQLTEEKKKKREQKQQMASQLREAKEKERTEKLKKLMEEREGKTRKKVLEAEQKRQLEEINRNLKLQEEKREAQRRLEKQKQLEKTETARKERELLENMKIQKFREQMQLKILHNQNLISQKMAKGIERVNAPKYDFDMLNSGDSTDEEDRITSKRPSPPAWSKSGIRQLCIERQVHLPTKIIDSFFSVQPMTPDLREIFPKIDARYLKRNSSILWNTPPRYSELPKY